MPVVQDYKKRNVANIMVSIKLSGVVQHYVFHNLHLVQDYTFRNLGPVQDDGFHELGNNGGLLLCLVRLAYEPTAPPAREASGREGDFRQNSAVARLPKTDLVQDYDFHHLAVVEDYGLCNLGLVEDYENRHAKLPVFGGNMMKTIKLLGVVQDYGFHKVKKPAKSRLWNPSSD